MRGLRIAAVTFFGCTALFLAVPLVGLFSSGGILATFAQAGPLLVGVLLVQLVAIGVATFAVARTKPMNLGLVVAGPVFVVVMGVVATSIGLRRVVHAVLSLSTADAWRLLEVGVAEASTTLHIAKIAAGITMLGLALAGGLAALRFKDDQGFAGAITAFFTSTLGTTWLVAGLSGAAAAGSIGQGVAALNIATNDILMMRRLGMGGTAVLLLAALALVYVRRQALAPQRGSLIAGILLLVIAIAAPMIPASITWNLAPAGTPKMETADHLLIRQELHLPPVAAK